MPDLLIIALLIGLALVAGAGFVLVQRQIQIAERDALQALAARRGWSLTISDQKLGRPGVLRLTSRSGLGWTAQARRHGPGDSGSPPPQTTEFEAEEPRWPDGLLIIGPGLPGAGSDAAAQYLDLLDTPDGKKWLARFLGEDVAKYSAVLHHYPTDAAITVLATADPTHRFDFGDIAKLVADWDMQTRRENRRPILILGPDGMRLRLRHGTHRADQMERFVDLALDLVRIL